MPTPKYLVVVNWIKEKIENKSYRQGDKIDSEMELCRLHGVSRQTVRQALNVLEQEGMLIRRQGSGTFVSVPALKNSNSRTRTVGVISTYFSDYIFPDIITGMEQVLSRHNVGMQLALTRNKVENEEKALASMLGKNISALIVEPSKSALPNPNMRLYKEIETLGIPLIFFNARYEWSSFPCIALNDVKAGQAATEYLIETGHRKIAGFFMSDDIQGHLRYKGYMNTLRTAGIEADEKNILWYASDDLGDLLNYPDRIMSRIKDCDAVVCYNDQLAFKLMSFCDIMGISVPEQLSVIGIDNSNHGDMSAVPLTTVAHPKAELGERAAVSMLTLMDNPGAEVEYFYEPKLIVRASVQKRGLPIPQTNGR
jgi:Transcriptional regulators